MRKARFIAAAGLLAVGIGAVPLTAGAATSATAATTVNLKINGETVGGILSAGGGKIVGIIFTATNTSKTHGDGGDIVSIAQLTGGTYVDSDCDLRFHFAGNGDGDLCESGLAPGRSLSDLYYFQTGDTASDLIVQGCVTGNHPDPVPGNNCAKLVIPID